MTTPEQSKSQPILDAVRTAWQSVLPLKEPDDHESFAEAGGDSLGALKLIAMLEVILHRPLSYDLVDMDVTPETLAFRIDAFYAERPPDGSAPF